MYPFFESIAVISGQTRNLFYHQKRMDKTFKHYYPGSESHHLDYLLSKIKFLDAPMVKCKFSYNETAYKIYQIKYQIKKYHAFYLLEDNSISYAYKFTDRTAIENLQSKVSSDSQVIITIQNRITDSSFSNIIFFDGYRWLTPANPLLPGTMRASLLAEWRIHEESIQTSHLAMFKSFKLINALNTFEDSPEYPIELINPTLIKT
jgi:4-amino-4-deoxychorismate lyase